MTNALDIEMRITSFPDVNGSKRATTWMSLGEFAAGAIAQARAPDKASLPLMKLAAFGERRSAKGSLRHDKNVLECSGAEVDYDGGALPLDKAVAILKAARLPAVIYTTASHTPARPRYRILTPFSAPRPEWRAKMVSRIAGLFPVEMAAGSWTLSQAYFYGSVEGQPPTVIVEVEGDDFVAVDLRDDLDAAAKAKPGKTNGANGQADDWFDPRTGTADEDDLRARIATGGEGTHDALISLAGLLARRGTAENDLSMELQDALQRRPVSARNADWHNHLADIQRLVQWTLRKEQERRAAEGNDPWAQAAAAGQPSLPELPPEPDWPEPIGREAYRGLLGEIVDATIATTEADRNAILIQHLVFLGNAIGIDANAPFCVIGNRGIHRPNLFTLIVGESAYSRKGTSTDDVGAIYASVDGQWFKDHIKSGLSSGEGLIYAVRDQAMGLDDKGDRVVVDAGSSIKNILVIEGEFGGPLSVMQRQGNTLATVIRNAWDGKKLETITRHQPMQATDHLVSIIGQITIAELRQKLLVEDAQSGFANRFLIALARRERLLPRPVPLSGPVIDGFALRLREAIRTARTRGQMGLSEDGWMIWESIYSKLGENKHGLYGAVVSRGDAQMRRIAMLYALLDGKGTIEPAHLSAAYAVWRYCTASAFYLFSDKQIDPFTDRLLDELRHAPSGLTRTELHAAFGRHVTKGALTSALARLLRDGLVKRDIRTTAGRPAELWTYNAGRRP